MLILYPNPILSKKAAPIKDPQDPKIKELVFEMLETMEKNNGLGLAAPQVGQSLRLCTIKLDGRTYVLINPRFLRKSWRKEIGEEGCLSFPGQFVLVKRHSGVKVAAQNEKGEPVVIKATGLLSRALQHEIDHLEGITIEERKIKSHQ